MTMPAFERLYNDLKPHYKARAGGFALALRHLFMQPGHIIETGSARAPNDLEGTGASTLLFAGSLLSVPAEHRLYSIDIDPAPALKCRDADPEACERVDFIIGDSVTALEQMPEEVLARTRVVYLDSLDYPMGEQHSLDRYLSEAHHLNELSAVYDRLPSDTLIMVDDRIDDATGKHVLVESYLRHVRGLEPIYKGAQIAWIKP